MFLFYVLSFFKKGDTIQGGTLLRGGHYLRKYGILHMSGKLHYIKSRNAEQVNNIPTILCSVAFQPEMAPNLHLVYE